MSGISRRNFIGGTAGAASLILTGTPCSAASEDTVVTIAQGKLRGSRNKGIYAFKGIPYGAPPTGVSRFQAPKPAAPWTDVRDATQFGPSSIQSRSPMFKILLPPMSTLLGWGTDENKSEDCLVLNVWTPGLDNKKRPVMFRIHGGGFARGSGSWPQSDGTNLAARGDVVVVTVNHRLNILGYLYLGDIGGDRYADSGNAGMLDLVLALRWVRDNIERFGGDPGKVMIFGESGGGSKVSTLLAMPPAQGLFHRAVIQSGASLKAATKDAATATAGQILSKLGVSPQNLDALHKLPSEAFAAQLGAIDRAIGPVLDGRSITAHPGDAMAQGASATVPVMIGTNQTETTLGHLNELPKIAALDWAGVQERLKPQLQANTDRVIEAYKRLWPKATPGDVLLYVEADMRVRTSSIRLAERKQIKSSAPVFMYLFAWRGNALDGQFKSAHGLEVPFTMYNVDTATALSETPTSRALAERMSDAWIAFARNGDPNVSVLPRWPAYSMTERATMILNDAPAVVNDPYGERPMWEEITPE